MADNKLHPAVTVTNIRNFIHVTLEMEKGQYSSWAEIFKIHYRAFQVIDHIIPPSSSSSSDANKQKDKAVNDDLWSRIDAIVLQWIYGTISNDLLHTILKPYSTVAQAWNSLANIFQDNRHSRLVYLENKFSNTRLDNFSNVSAYCQELKMLSDQLSNVGAPIQNQ
ncbi:hypothetical protein L6452_03537 [Arctium lappa]|uniref:Uncharacterized protein n=1 Tax=Arctium lappa TaxID=4217 RepID=A0ACB9FNI1_ARCLA|nr:hypothetical protein L6452_03537 [Arctium lappa]